MRRHCFLCCLLFVVCCFGGAYAQITDENGHQNKKENKSDEDRSLIAAFDYGSDKLVYGRRGNTKYPYLAPSLSYESPGGFFAGIAVYRLLQPLKQWDEADLDAGYSFKISHKWKSSIGYSHFIYSKNSPQIKSSLKNQVEYYISPATKVITPKLYLDYLFSDTTHDFVTTFDLLHEFEFDNIFTDDNDDLLIRPTVSFFLGTINYISGIKTTAKVNSRFGFTGMELSLPVEYDIGRFIFEAAGHYNIPRSVSTNFKRLTEAQKQKLDALLNSSPEFYFTLSLGFAII